MQKTLTWKHTHTHMDAHKDSNEYSIVAFCKNATIMTPYFWKMYTHVTLKSLGVKKLACKSHGITYALNYHVLLFKEMWALT